MRYRFLLIVLLLCTSLFASSQNVMREAFVLTKMMDKFHVQPKAVDDSLSSVIFDNFFKLADPYRILFTQHDIQQLNVHRYQLDDEIKKQQSAFIPAVKQLFIQRINESDSLISVLTKNNLDLSANESLSKAEEENFPSVQNKKSKLNKYLKSAIISAVAEELSYDSTILDDKKAIDTLVLHERNNLRKKFRQMFQLLLNGPGGADEVIRETFCEAVANAYDPHSDYFSEAKKKSFEHFLGNSDYDYGFSVDEDEDGEPGIGNIRPGTAAFKTGQLSEGDKIKAVRWEGGKNIDVSDATAEELNRILKSGNEKPLTLIVKKADNTIKEITLSQSKVEADDEDEKVKSFVLTDKMRIGYIALPTFYSDWENASDKNVKGCANDIAKEIIKLKKENINALILDLRYNGGGSVQEAAELAGIFIDAGPVAQIKYRTPKPDMIRDVNRGTVYDGPLFLLVNRYSASASELLAAALQDYKRAIIVGAPTYGKATGQLVLPMDTSVIIDESILTKKAAAYVKITMMTLYRVNGETAQGRGVIPDIQLPEFSDDDAESESSNPLYLRTSNIEGNKFYKPLVNRYTQDIQTIAKEELSKENFFTQLDTFQKQQNLRKGSPSSLNLTAALAAVKNKMSKSFQALEMKAYTKSFNIESGSLEKQREAVSLSTKLMNDSVKENIASDPYIGTLFRIIQRLNQ